MGTEGAVRGNAGPPHERVRRRQLAGFRRGISTTGSGDGIAISTHRSLSINADHYSVQATDSERVMQYGTLDRAGHHSIVHLPSRLQDRFKDIQQDRVTGCRALRYAVNHFLSPTRAVVEIISVTSA